MLLHTRRTTKNSDCADQDRRFGCGKDLARIAGSAECRLANLPLNLTLWEVKMEMQ